MLFRGRSARPGSGQGKQIVLLALLLSVGIVGFQLVIDAAFGRSGGGMAYAPRDMLLSVPAALAAAWLGLRLAPRPEQGRPADFAGTLNRAALVALTFMLLFIPSALLGRFFAASPGSHPGPGSRSGPGRPGDARRQ